MKNQQIDGEHAGANPIRGETLNQSVEDGHENRPGRASEKRKEGQDPERVPESRSSEDTREDGRRDRDHDFYGVSLAQAAEKHGAEHRARSKKSKQETVAHRTIANVLRDGG